MTGSNGQPAVAVYARTGERHALLAVQVLTVAGGRIEAITGFTEETLFPFFALPPELDSGNG